MMYMPFHRQTLMAGTMALSAGLFAIGGNEALAFDGRSVGVVEQVLGTVLIERGGERNAAVAGRQLQRHDRLLTLRDARVAVAFNDGSRLVLGDQGDIGIEDWRPERGRSAGALLLDLAAGAVRLTAARPNRAPDRRVELRTPAAVASLHGTDLWSGPFDGATGFIVLAGSVDLRNDAGSVRIDRRNLGTLIGDRRSAPERPRGFSPDQLLRAIAAVEMGLK